MTLTIQEVARMGGLTKSKKRKKASIENLKKANEARVINRLKKQNEG